MRALLILTVVASLPLRAEEPAVSLVRQRLHTKLLESLSPFQPAKAPDPTEFPAIFVRLPESVDSRLDQQIADSAIVMSPFVVSEYWRDRALKSDIAGQTQPAPFSPVEGGTLYAKDLGRVRMKVGGWWSPHQGWSFLKFSW